MNTEKLKTEEIMKLVQRHNEPEIKRRKDYYAYLCEREPQKETLEQHLERFAQIIRVGEKANAEEIREIERRIGIQLPQELREFYLEIGKLDNGNFIQIFSLRELMDRFHSEIEWKKISSIGLADMIKASWQNDRFEFDPANECLTQSEIETLNQNYFCLGWLPDGNGEAFTYIYFDRSGKFGSLFYHQDDFDEFYKKELVPMLKESKATQTLSEVILGEWKRPPRKWPYYDH